MGTRTLTGLAATLFIAGCALGAVGLHPAVSNPTLSRFGMLMTTASIPPWIVSSMRVSARLTEDQLADAHLAGYRQCLDHLGAARESGEGSVVPARGRRSSASQRTAERHDR